MSVAEFKKPVPRKGEAAMDYRIRCELKALNFCVAQLLKLDQDGRRRAILYLKDRYIDHPEVTA